MKKRFMRTAAVVLAGITMLSGYPSMAYAQTLTDAGKTESTRGYGGAGTQDKNRTEDYVTVKLSFGGGGTSSSNYEELESFKTYVAKDDVEMLNRSIQVHDLDKDGDIDMTDLLKEADAYKRGDVELAYTTSDMGDFYTNAFGINAGGSFLYWLNGSQCQYGIPDLYDGDDIVMVALTGDYNSWGTTDDSAYDGHRGTKNFTSVADVRGSSVSSSDADDSTKDDSSRKDEASDKDNSSKNDDSTQTSISYHTYLTQMENNLSSWSDSTSLSDGSCYWQEMRILNFVKGGSSVYTEKLPYFKANYTPAVGSKAVNDMRRASVTGETEYLETLAHGSGDKSAYDYDKAAGMYAVDYILMCLDLNNYAVDEALADNLSDYADSPSVRDDLINYIVTTSGCWGGGWWTYDIGAQNAQALVPYYTKYAEVKEKLDAYNTQAYNYFMDESNTGSTFDASSAGEYIRFASMLSNETSDPSLAAQAKAVYDKVNAIGLANTKFKGNAMDVTRMAIAEWGLNDLSTSTTPTDVVSGELKLSIDQASVGKSVKKKTSAHIKALKAIDDAQLYECELKIPENLTVNGVTSTVADVQYGIEGSTLRITLSNLDGKNLAILKDSNIIDMDVSVSKAGTYKFEVLSSTFRSSSKDSRTSTITSVSTEIIKNAEITASVLYKGAASSRFVPKDKEAVKIVVGSNFSMNGYLQLKLGDVYYDCYETTDFNNDVATFVAFVPSSTSLDTLSDIDNYYVADGSSKELIFGDVDNDSNITSADALAIVKAWVGKTKSVSEKEVLAANVTGDSDLDNADTLSIVEHIVNSEEFNILK